MGQKVQEVVDPDTAAAVEVGEAAGVGVPLRQHVQEIDDPDVAVAVEVPGAGIARIAHPVTVGVVLVGVAVQRAVVGTVQVAVFVCVRVVRIGAQQNLLEQREAVVVLVEDQLAAPLRDRLEPEVVVVDPRRPVGEQIDGGDVECAVAVPELS